MTPLVISIVIALVVAYHALPALAIYATQRFPEDICVAPFQPDAASLPADVADYFANAEAALLRLGFERVGGIALPDPMPRVKAILVAYIHPTQRDAAMVSVIYGVATDRDVASFGRHGAEPPNLKPLQHRYVEFVARYRDEVVRLVQTNNSDNTGSFPARPTDLTFRFPQVADVEHLYRLHQKLAAQHGPSSRKVVRLFDEFHGDLVRYVHAMFVETYRDQEQTGYVRYDVTRRHWRPTLRGAGLMTWCELPPWKQLRTLRVRQLGRNLERELENQ